MNKQDNTSNLEITENKPIVELNSSSPADVTIYATDEINKTDGVVVIGDVINNQYTPREQVIIEQIDIEKKKQEKKVKEDRSKKKKNKIASTEEKKANTITSLIVLLVVGLLVAGYYYWTNRETEADFKLRNITLELGRKVSTKVADYVTWKKIDELTYRLDVSKVNSSVVGEYKYAVTHAQVTKYGKVTVKDTIAPKATTKDLVFALNESYSASDFIENCKDLSGCKAKFSDGSETKVATTEGKDTAHIYIYDKYENMRLLKVAFMVGSTTNQLICNRIIIESVRTINDNVSLTFDSNNLFISGSTTTSYIYKDKAVYDEFKLRNQAIDTYVFSDSNLKVSETYQYQAKIYNLNDKTMIQNKLIASNYICE